MRRRHTPVHADQSLRLSLAVDGADLAIIVDSPMTVHHYQTWSRYSFPSVRPVTLHSVWGEVVARRVERKKKKKL
jgi:hypothetical protein